MFTTFISQTEQFLLNSALGAIIGGIIATILGSILCYLYRKIWSYIQRKYKKQRTKQKILDQTVEFYRGAAAAYSKESSYKQILLVGDYLIDLLLISLKIIVLLVITCIFICISDDILLDMLIVIVFSFMIYFQYSNLKRICKEFKQTYDYVFGEDFTDRCVKGAMETFNKNASANEGR